MLLVGIEGIEIVVHKKVVGAIQLDVLILGDAVGIVLDAWLVDKRRLKRELLISDGTGLIVIVGIRTEGRVTLVEGNDVSNQHDVGNGGSFSLEPEPAPESVLVDVVLVPNVHFYFLLRSGGGEVEVFGHLGVNVLRGELLGQNESGKTN